MKKREICLLSVTMFLFGIVSGFLLAPIKQGVGNNSGNNNGNNTYNYYRDEEVEQIEEVEEEVE